jgi:uncharacterized protein YlxW (UPF0749 family)
LNAQLVNVELQVAHYKSKYEDKHRDFLEVSHINNRAQKRLRELEKQVDQQEKLIERGGKSSFFHSIYLT